MAKDKQILVIDDDVAILEAIRLTLEEEGYDVTTSEDTDILTTSINRTKKPSLIILDMLLSGKDGRDVAKKLKSDRETQKIPIVMISAHPSAQETVRKFGADDFIAKPFDIDELIEKVNQYTS